MDPKDTHRPPPSLLDIGQATDVGRMRAQNEDSFCAVVLNDPDGPAAVLLAVADGMGGEEAGEVASSITIQALMHTAAARVASGRTPELGWLQDTVAMLNRRVVDEARDRGHAMGTTLVAALVRDNVAHLVSVGDSRIYRWRPADQTLTRLTRDHSLVQALVDEGVIDDADRYMHPRRNYITRSLGDPGTGYSDELAPVVLEHGDWLLLCSDGLWEMIRDEDMIRVLALNADAQKTSDMLVALANMNGGEDNITVVIARMPSA
jgi:serine/threonine protein phosphatase PrpC